MGSPSQLVQPHHVIRLTSFQSKESSKSNSPEMLAAWQQLWGNRPPGMLYAELCEQVPEWSAQAAAEIDNPILSEFLEYAVFEPDTDFLALPTLPPAVISRYDTAQGLYNVAFRFVKDDPGETPAALMFNLFEIDGPPAMEQAFLMAWPPRGAFKIRESAVFATALHQRIQPAAMAAFNRSEVRDAPAYAEGIQRFEKAFPRTERKAVGSPAPSTGKPPIRSHLGLFRIAASLTGAPSPVKATMKAAIVHRYGPPEVLVYGEAPRPSPGPGQILVEVKAISINPLDVRMRSGEVESIYPPWFPDTLGYSVSGVVKALGAGAASRHLGEEVYGINNPIMRQAYAEYVIGPESFYYPKPTKMEYAAAAAAPSIFATAYGALFGRAHLQAGQRLLIHGGSGVIGSCAVQLAKQAGAYVIATASAKNSAFVQELGADLVIDYKAQRFEDFACGLDLVLDTVGGDTRERSWQLLKLGGTLASLQPPDPDLATAAKFGVQAFMVHGHPNVGEIMPEMTRRLASGELRFPEVAAVFPLSQAAAAHALFERQPPRGRIILVP